ncbi:unnamed protein product [Rhizoctonia solani]|uniref:CHAT domain-containing protein n=1 Tax=Rhizoctonia solani TaxID=456999 RepID=A0A8H2W735_9AGAM|nr:unnamed protein product [Rhizoctonia solani]
MLSIVPDEDPSVALVYEIFDNLCESHAQRVQAADNHIYSTPIVIATKSDPETIYDLGVTHKAQFNREGKLNNLERAIGCMTSAVELSAETDAELPKYLFGLADVLLERFDRFSGFEFLEDAIEYQRRGVSLLTHSKPDFLANLGYSLMRRFQLKGDTPDLDEAINLQELAVASTTKDTKRAEVCYNTLGMSLVLRFENTSDLLNLDRAIELYQRALELDLATEDRAAIANNIGSALQKKYFHRRDIDYIDRAIAHQQKAVDSTLDSHTGKPGYLTNLAISLYHRFEYLGKMGDINRAISHQLDALDLLPSKHNLRPSLLGDLGNSYLLLFGNTGYPIDIQQSISRLTDALELTPLNNPDRPKWLMSLGHAFRQKFEILGELVDIDRAIGYHHQSVAATSKGHMDQADRLDHLGNAYMSRFERLRELADLDNAIEQHRAALAIFGRSNKKAQAAFHNLGGALCRRFDQVGELEDIDESVTVIQQAIEISAKTSYLSILQNSLGVSLLSRYRCTNRIEDIEESVSCLVQAVSLTADGHPDMSAWLQNLSSSLNLRYYRTGNIDDIEKAIEYQTKAVDMIPEYHMSRPALLSVLGDALALRHLATDQPKRGKRDDAINAFRTAALSTVGSPHHRFTAAYKWAQMLLLQEESPLEAYRVAFTLVPQVVWIGKSIDQRYEDVTSISHLTSAAVSSAIAEREYMLALEWFEAGRLIVWGQMLQLRTPLDELRAADQSLAEKVEKVAHELDRAGSLRPSRINARAQANAFEQVAQSHHRLAEDWDQLLRQIRQFDGFSDFLLPKKANALLKVAHDGDVVVINVHEAMCHALVIRRAGFHLDCIPLSGLSHQKASDAQKQLIQLLRLSGVRQRSGESGTPLKDRSILGKIKDLRRPFSQMALKASLRVLGPSKGAPSPHSSPKNLQFLTGKTARRPFLEEEASHNNEMEGILEFLWFDIVHPILSYLNYLSPNPNTDLPHITWCVSGPLAFLPLHAAGNYKVSTFNARSFNCVVASYSPTLSGLLASAPSIKEFSGLLMIGQASTPGLSALPRTERDLDSIARHANSLRFSGLTEHDATPNTVLEAIGRHSWVHFACHASQIAQDPTSSAFYLHTGTLDLSTITKRSLGRKAFAFLSACQTATGDIDLPEEAVHLAAGIIMAGYPTVIATMWSIGDSDAPLVADRTYAQMFKGGKPDSTNASRALHQALSVLRAKVGENNFISWVPYIHIGI